jgi:hypothetical protein
LKIAVFWDMTPRILADKHVARSAEDSSILYPEDRESKYL